MSEETTKELIDKLPAMLTALGVILTAIPAIIGAIYAVRAHAQSKKNATDIAEMGRALQGEKL